MGEGDFRQLGFRTIALENHTTGLTPLEKSRGAVLRPL
jgi:hypothetical protein